MSRGLLPSVLGRRQHRCVKPLWRSPQPSAQGWREWRPWPCRLVSPTGVLPQHFLFLVAIVVVDGQRVVVVDVPDNAWEPSTLLAKAGVHTLANLERRDRGLGTGHLLGLLQGWFLHGLLDGLDECLVGKAKPAAEDTHRASAGVRDQPAPANHPATRECMGRVGCGHHAHVRADQL